MSAHWQPCKKCGKEMWGIKDCAAREVCRDCGGHNKIDSVEILMDIEAARAKEKKK